MKTSWWQYREWSFVADMNRDGAVTGSDAQLWLEWLYFLPGDAVIARIGGTPLGKMLELAPESFGGPTSALISAALWLLVFFLPGLLVDAVDPTYRQQKRERREALAKARSAQQERLRRLRRRAPLWRRTRPAP